MTNDDIKELDTENTASEQDNQKDKDLPGDETEDKEVEEREEIVRDETYYYGLFEAVLFLSNDPVPVSFFAKNFQIDSKDVKIIIDSIIDEYEERGGGIILKEFSDGYQFITRDIFADDIRHALFFDKKEGLSRGMLETLSIIAYKQPIILAEIEELRGVSSRMMLAKLMKRNLVKPVGRKELPGRPLLYGTTDDFLKHFGLKTLSDLPTLSEIEELYYDEKE